MPRTKQFARRKSKHASLKASYAPSHVTQQNEINRLRSCAQSLINVINLHRREIYGEAEDSKNYTVDDRNLYMEADFQARVHHLHSSFLNKKDNQKGEE